MVKPNIETPETGSTFWRLHHLLMVVKKPSTSHLLTLVCWSDLHQSKYLLHSWNSFYQSWQGGNLSISDHTFTPLTSRPQISVIIRDQDWNLSPVCYCADLLLKLFSTVIQLESKNEKQSTVFISIFQSMDENSLYWSIFISVG